MRSGGCSQHSDPNSDRNSGDAGRKTGRLLDRMASDDQLGSVGANRCPLAPSFLCHFPLLVCYPSPAAGWRRRRWQLGSGRAAGASDRARCRLGGGSQVAAAGNPAGAAAAAGGCCCCGRRGRGQWCSRQGRGRRPAETVVVASSGCSGGGGCCCCGRQGRGRVLLLLLRLTQRRRRAAAAPAAAGWSGGGGATTRDAQKKRVFLLMTFFSQTNR